MIKIVFLTNKQARGAHILRELKNRSIPVEAILIDAQRPAGLRAKVDRIRQLGVAGTWRMMARKAKKTLAPMELRTMSQRKRRRLTPGTTQAWLSNDFYQRYSSNVCVVDDINGEHCERLLKELAPDLVVLGGTGILHKNIIDIPKTGILNAHPGLLPKYRGVDVIPWAIYHGDPVGVTVHFVNEGIDTGDIVATRSVGVDKSDTIEDLGKKADRLAGELMAETVLKIVQGDSIETVPQTIPAGKQYHRMPAWLFRQTVRKLKTMTEAVQDGNCKDTVIDR